MNLLLKFDYASYVVSIPDGYVRDIKTLQNDFFEWLYWQKENITDLGVAYGAQDFVRFINETLLRESAEVAYLLPEPVGKKIHGKLSF